MKMNTMMLTCVALFISLASFAQTDSTHQIMHKEQMTEHTNHNMDSDEGKSPSYGDGLLMLNGKMMWKQNGKMTMMSHDTTMTNGTKVMTDGTCISKDGTKMMMKEGQHMDKSGKMMPINDAKIMKH